jgi:hypothetical protein
MSEPRTTRLAPASHYMLAVAFGAVATIAVAFVVGATNPGDFWLAAGIGALCAAYPAFSLGARLFVTNHTVTVDARGEESVELAWMRQAASGAFLDVLLTTIVLAVVAMLWKLDVDALVVLLALIGLSAADAGLRYLAIRHRALK